MNLPPILRQLQGNNIQQIRNMMGMVKSAGNPQAMLSQMMQNNPQMRQVMDAVQQYGGDPQKAFYGLCQQNGVNPDEIINMLR